MPPFFASLRKWDITLPWTKLFNVRIYQLWRFIHEHGVRTRLWKVKPLIKSRSRSLAGQVDSCKMCSRILNHPSDFVYGQHWSLKWDLVTKILQKGVVWVGTSVQWQCLARYLWLIHKGLLTPEALLLTSTSAASQHACWLINTTVS